MKKTNTDLSKEIVRPDLSVDFFDSLAQTSRSALLAVIYKIAQTKNIPSLMNLVQAISERPSVTRAVNVNAPQQEVTTEMWMGRQRKHTSIPNASLAHALSLAFEPSDEWSKIAVHDRLWQVQLGNASKEWVRPEAPPLSQMTLELLDRIMEVMAPIDIDFNSRLLFNCAAQVRDARVFNKLIDAGANPWAMDGNPRHPGLRVDNKVGHWHDQALCTQNAAAIVHVLQALAKKKDASLQRRQPIALHDHLHNLAMMMSLGGRSNEGLAAVCAIEEIRPAIKSPEKNALRMLLLREFRMLLLHEYLELSEQQRIGWDLDQVNYLLGDDRPLQSAPQQTAIQRMAAQQIDYNTTDQSNEVVASFAQIKLLSMALRTHCWPVIKAMPKTLQHVRNQPDLLSRHNLGLCQECDGTTIGSKISAAMVMVCPVNVSFHYDCENFSKTLKIIDDAGLLDIDKPGAKNRHINALHIAANYVREGQMELMTQLLQAGVDPAAVMRNGHTVVDELQQSDSRSQWMQIVQSHKTRQAAINALDTLDTLASNVNVVEHASTKLKIR